MEEREMETIKFAFVGCGRIASRHANILSNIPEAQLVAVADINPEKGERLSQRFQVPAFTDFREMLEKEEVDVVDILTPSGTHGRVALEVMRRFNKHVLVEKPITLLLSEAYEMVQEAYKRGLFLITVVQNRFNLPVVKLREALEAGRFGRLVLGSARLYWCRRQDYYDADVWRGTWAVDGGVLANQACHYVDMLQWMMGPIDSIFAKSTRSLIKMEAEDTFVAVLKFRNGALGTIEATVCARPRDLEGALTIIGERGTVELGGFAMNKINLWDFEEPEFGDSEVKEKYRENPPDVYGFGHHQYLKGVVRYILDQGDHVPYGLALGEEGVRSLEIIQAAYESVEKGEEVVFPFTPVKSRLGVG